MKILILGGYGVFGGRLAELLADIPALELLICGRSAVKASAFCEGFFGAARVEPVLLDRINIAAALARHKPDIVVDASGPFQNYGDNPYLVVQACIDARVNYLDFADAADFVFGIAQFDQASKDAGIYVLAGVSSFPVLTAAVLREVAKDMSIISVTGGIAPSPYAGIGLNVMRAVMGYAGGPVKLRRNGQRFEAKGLTESKRYTIAPPGMLPLRNLWFSLVDVPDLQVIPPEHPEMQDIWIGAGPVPETLHRALNVLAKLRAWLHLPALTPFSKLFYTVLNLMKFGEHRGGMFVHVKGKRNGQLIEKSWHLLAEGDDGPYIPSMAIEAILRKQLAGDMPEFGARAATNSLELTAYEKLFENRTIYTGFREAATGPIYQQVLGKAFDTLPVCVKSLHSLTEKQVWTGEAEVQRGKGKIAGLIAKIIGFPPAGNNVPLRVSLTPSNNTEIWQRNFDGKIFRSIQRPGKGRNKHLMLEKFGPVTVALALVIRDGCLHLIPRRWFFLGLPLPKFLLPRGETFETERGGKFRFHVTIKAPVIGLIVAYDGWLERK